MNRAAVVRWQTFPRSHAERPTARNEAEETASER